MDRLFTDRAFIIHGVRVYRDLCQLTVTLWPYECTHLQRSSTDEKIIAYLIHHPLHTSGFYTAKKMHYSLAVAIDKRMPPINFQCHFYALFY